MKLVLQILFFFLTYFSSSATSLFAKTEISTFLREVEINRAVSGNSNISLLIESTGDQNLVKIAHNGATYNLAYLDPDINGKVIYSNLNFIEASSSEIDEILQVVTDANFKKANNTIVYNKKFTLVKTHSGLIKVVDGVVNGAGNDLLNAFKPGYTKEGILAIPHGSRPNPSTYLHESYINSHLSKFEYDDVVRVTNQTSINAHGGTLGGTDAFVLPKSEFMEILAEHGRDLRAIETKLGFPPNSLGEDAVFALIKREDLGTFKMPTGNESGIIDEFWMPGGKTSGGVSEATVDLTTIIPYVEL